MFQKDDLIIYGDTGVCRVEEICTPKHISLAYKDKLYYKLVPVYDDGVIYTPVDTKVFMRPVITQEEVDALISKIPEMSENVYENNNLRLLSDHYQASLQTHKCEDLLQLIKTVYVKNQNCRQNGKPLGLTDQKYMKRAEELLHGEFAVALGVAYEDVKKYIERSVSELELQEKAMPKC